MPPKSRRRWLRFSLRTMMAAVTVAGIALGLWLKHAEHERQRSAVAAVATLEKSLAYVWFASAPTADEWATAEWEENFQDGNYPTDIYRIEFPDSTTDADLAPLRSLSNVRAIAIDGTQVTAAGLENLRGLTRLESLSLAAPLGDEGLAALGGLTNLQDLRLYGPDVTEEGLAHLRNLTRLKRLFVSHTSLTSVGLKQIAGLTTLVELQLRDADLRGADLTPLRGLMRLRRLCLRSGIDDADLAHIGTLSGLESLDLSGNRVSDAGLVHLRGLKNLGMLILTDTYVTESGIDGLQQLLPKCQVHWWDGCILK